MKRLLQIACGLDVHKDIIEACVFKNKWYDEPDVIHESFSALRGDLIRLRDWLSEHNCSNVAMESTGVFWKPVYEILEEVDGMNLYLVNAYHMRNIPGRKDDEADAEWIAELYMHGLLENSFVPEKGIRDLREYARFYKKLDQERVRIVNRLEKFLQTHGFKLSSVISHVDGVSARRILEQLCEQGKVSIADVQACLARGVRKSADEIAYAINGILSDTSRILLRQILDVLYVHERQLQQLRINMETVSLPYVPQIEVLTSIPGIDVLSATYIISEIGIDMSRFEVRNNWKKSESRLISWAGLCPRNDISAGKIKSKKINKGNTYVKSILVQCAWASIKKRNTRLSNWYWHNVGRLGQKKAIIAVARKLLCYIFQMLSTGELYNDELDRTNIDRINAQKLESVEKRLSKLVEKTQQQSASVALKDNNTQKNGRPKVIQSHADKENEMGKKSPILDPTQSDISVAETPKKRGRPKKNLAAS